MVFRPIDPTRGMSRARHIIDLTRESYGALNAAAESCWLDTACPIVMQRAVLSYVTSLKHDYESAHSVVLPMPNKGLLRQVEVCNTRAFFT